MVLIKRDPLRTNVELPQSSENIDLMKERPGRLIQPPCGDTKTNQSYKDQYDINKIIDRYNRTGEFRPLRKTEPVFRDLSAFDFEQMENRIAEIEGQFTQLPVEIRKRFDHSALEMLRFLENPKNRDEAIKLGLVKPPKESAAEGGKKE
jgi:phage internal scaffolding protein